MLLLLHLQGLGLLGLSGHLPGTLKGLEVVDGVFVVATPDAVHHLAVVAHRLIQLCGEGGGRGVRFEQKCLASAGGIGAPLQHNGRSEVRKK